MAKTNSTAAPANPLITNHWEDTLNNAKGIASYLAYSVPSYIECGSNDDATHGLTMLLEVLADTIDQAHTQAQAVFAASKVTHHE